MKRTIKRWIRPLVRTNLFAGLKRYPAFVRDLRGYRRMEGAEPLRLKDTYPCLFDNTESFSPANQYYYQDIWALGRIYASGVRRHVDVGSKAEFVGFLTAFTNVEFVDIRPLDAPYLKNFKSIAGSVLEMPYGSDTLESVSCLHVAEHVGLGRYGDPLDPEGTKKAAGELSRCLAKGGRLYFSLPVGRPRLCFNAHRIHSPGRILEYFGPLKLAAFNLFDDRKRFIENADPAEAENAKFACGMFEFTK
jgi:hypothetical protein